VGNGGFAVAHAKCRDGAFVEIVWWARFALPTLRIRVAGDAHVFGVSISGANGTDDNRQGIP